MAAHRKLAAVLAAALVLLLIVAFVAALARDRLEASAREVVESYETVAALSRVQSDVLDAETGQRGFLLTGEDAYLQPWRQATARIDDDVVELKTRLVDPELQSQLAELLALVDRRLALLKQRIELRRSSGLAETAAAMRTGGGHEIMNALRALVGAMSARERERLTERSSRIARDVARADLLVEGGSLLGAALLCALALLLGREMRTRQRREESLRDHVAITDGVLASMTDAVVVADRDGNIALTNDAAHRRLPNRQGPAGDLFGARPPVLFRADGITPIAPAETPLVLALHGQTTQEAECLYRAPGAEPQWLGVSARPLTDSRGAPSGAVSVFRDVTRAKRASLALQHANARLQTSVDELRHRNDEMALLGDLSQVLHSCGTTAEACALTAQFLARLCPGGSGAIHLLDETSARAERAAAWGRVAHLAHELRADECWALRRNATHVVDPQRLGLLCGHVASDVSSYACVPLTAPGECLGVLYVERATGSAVASMPGPGIVEAVAQEVSLTLANLRLRDMLLRHSVRDPLTGLCNRRVIDEWFDRELSRANRHGSSVGVLLIDVDHFKRFNDSLGHDAGDAMLKGLASMLREAVRTEDLVCRYGGEEFLVILGDTSAEHVARRAADLCQRARELEVDDGSRRLPPVTLSIGVALFPQHAGTADALLRAADRALYAAKEAGRDRVEVAAVAEQQPARIAAA